MRFTVSVDVTPQELASLVQSLEDQKPAKDGAGENSKQHVAENVTAILNHGSKKDVN